jgi:hypothetical protein
MDLTPYTGLDQFGPAYRRMLEGDCHALGSVDRVLLERMVRICAETAGYLYSHFTPAEVCYRDGSRPQLETAAARVASVGANAEGRIEGILEVCADVVRRAPDGLADLRVGGPEERIIERGTDWCTDLARVACALCQVNRIPARIVYLADIGQAYSGHAIIEGYRAGAWGAADPTGNVIYRHGTGRPATTWELMNDPELLMRHAPAPYTNPGQFRCAAVADYSICRCESYDYAESGLNDYCRSILEMSVNGWPGGLRWLHGEDAAG